MIKEIQPICYDIISEAKAIESIAFIKENVLSEEDNDKKYEEIKRCAKDPLYFMNAFLKIKHPTKGEIDFLTYDYQDNCIDDLENFNFNAIVKSRQLGFKTLMAAYCVWKLLYGSGENMLFFGTKLSTSKFFIEKMSYMLKRLPSWLVSQDLVDYKSQQITIGKNTIKAVPQSSDAGCSETITTAIFDEFAFFNDQEAIIHSIMPCLSRNKRQIIFMSIPNGTENEFYRMCRDEDFFGKTLNIEEYPYNVRPQRDCQWFESQLRHMSEKEVEEELCCEFLVR